MDANLGADKIKAMFDSIKSRGGLTDDERENIVRWLIENKSKAAEFVNSEILPPSLSDELADAIIEVHKYGKDHTS